MINIAGIPLSSATAEGRSMILDEPLSFWGGVDPASGEIIDRHHPQSGQSITGVVLVLRHARGSSGTPSVLTEGARAGTGPVGIVLASPDPMFVVGSLVIAELYPEKALPIVVVGDAFEQLADGVMTRIDIDGTVQQD